MQQVATGYGLIEGPVWDPARGLYYSDVVNGGVYLLNGPARRLRSCRSGAVSVAWPCMRRVDWS